MIETEITFGTDTSVNVSEVFYNNFFGYLLQWIKRSFEHS